MNHSTVATVHELPILQLENQTGISNGFERLFVPDYHRNSVGAIPIIFASRSMTCAWTHSARRLCTTPVSSCISGMSASTSAPYCSAPAMLPSAFSSFWKTYTHGLWIMGLQSPSVTVIWYKDTHNAQADFHVQICVCVCVWSCVTSKHICIHVSKRRQNTDFIAIQPPAILVNKFWSNFRRPPTATLWILRFSNNLNSPLQYQFEFSSSVTLWILLFSNNLNSPLQYQFEFSSSVSIWILLFSNNLNSPLQ